MKHLIFLSVFTTILSLFVVTGCSKKTGSFDKRPEAGLTKPQAEEQAGPEWTLKYTANCGTDAQEQCIGAYGFTIYPDQRYEVGPGPQGQIMNGTLEAEEFKMIESLVTTSATAPQTAAAAEACATRSLNLPEDSAKGSIVLNYHGSVRNLATLDDTNVCSNAVTTAQAESVYQAMNGLVRKYYPVPFPDPCIDAAVALDQMYPALRQCNVDSDCAYIDNSFTPIPTGELQFVITDDCTVIKPLTVANAKAVTDRQNDLLTARENARNICEARVVRINCTEISGFQASGPAPVCTQGICRVNPTQF